MSAGGSMAVRSSGVVKAYGSGDVAVHALRGISLTVPAGQFVVVLGPSGSGKTTMMNIVGGIEPPTSGTVEVAGQDLVGLNDRDLTAFRRDTVGFVFQFFNLVPTLTAFENVQLVAELVGNADPAVTRAAMQAVGLDARGDHFPAALSGGEQQRVAIARAIVKNPPLLLCDEPTGSLDLETGRQILAVLHRLSRTGGRFNTLSANIMERAVELTALRTLGMAPATIGRLVTAENLLLTLVALVPGLVFAYVLAAGFMASFSSDLFRFNLEVRPTTFAGTAAVILLVALLSQWPSLRAVRRLDLASVVRERAT